MANPRLSVEANEHHHEITLNWTIRNFQQQYDNAKLCDEWEMQVIAKDKFAVGEERWGIFLAKNEEHVGIFLEFLGTGCFSAEHVIYLKSSTGEFTKELTTGLRKYAPRDSIEGAGEAWGFSSWKTLSQLQNEGFLQNDELQMKVNVNVYSMNCKAQLKSDLSTDLKNGLNSVVGSDITFIFMEEGSEEVAEKIEAHKAILSLRSPVFAKMFGSGMKEATEGKVKIVDMTPKAMRILLDFIYSGSVGGDWGSVADELLYGADKYGLEQLKKFLCENISSALNVSNVWNIRKLASLYKLPQVLKATMKFLKEHTEDFVNNIDDITLKKN